MEGGRDLDVQRIGEEYIKDLQQQIYVLELENECLYPPQSLNSSASMPLAVSVSLCTFCVYAVGGGGGGQIKTDCIAAYHISLLYISNHDIVMVILIIW